MGWAGAGGLSVELGYTRRAGADIEAEQAEADWRPLHLVAWDGHTATVQLLLDRDANVKATTIDNWTSLHEAAAYGLEDTLQILLDLNADIEAKTSLVKRLLKKIAAIEE
ncbi:hypothetical protein BZA05DRAFT_457717 [Tricharina praecox]|uniref:uncharacterized protein n=1 Tax=Tricharina praecox TaxID=43433 RepID=UPI00221F30C5|nr:uncharacterized protein BZA05DRAFT_448918 [Tricharina praecox]XP_051337421.1 uncharacterized protein BZA05DRAFT_457717 [Tricharina praecox]KAI5843215.1 hypothetical protein BZA05DRAFT_448918 [Tricharina praecox]KAI5847612.1 hypothetical protein BZA05DRAFT_457717 [Tricharina praecox]